jgi:isoprenylcysteine carboxyl methyltransferase (ICMT) family protein YpbQ
MRGSRLGASPLLRPGMRMVLNTLVAISFLPVFLSLTGMKLFYLQENFSGVGIGSLIMVTGHLFQWYVIQLLGPFYTADISVFNKHRIIESGWYKILRHPQYLANFISFIGLSICFNDLSTQIILIIFPTLNLLLKIRLEERALKKVWDASYENYLHRTYRIIPYIY